MVQGIWGGVGIFRGRGWGLWCQTGVLISAPQSSCRDKSSQAAVRIHGNNLIMAHSQCPGDGHPPPLLPFCTDMSCLSSVPNPFIATTQFKALQEASFSDLPVHFDPFPQNCCCIPGLQV